MDPRPWQWTLTHGNSMQVPNMQSYDSNRKQPKIRFKPTSWVDGEANDLDQ